MSNKLLYIGFIGFVVVGMPGAALGVAWTYMQDTFEVSLDSLGILLGALTIGRLVMSIYSGRFIGWMGLGNYMVTGSVVMLIGLMGYILVPTWALLVMTALVFGFGVTMLNTGINTHAATHYKSSRMNWLHAWFGLGSALGPLVMTGVIVHLDLGWQWGYAIFIALQIGFTFIIFVTRASWRVGETSTPHADKHPRVSLTASLKLAATGFGITLFFLHGGIQYGTGALTESLFTQGRNISPGTAGLWISIYWGGLTAGRMFTGLVVDRIGNARFMRINMFMTIIGTLLLWSNVHNLLTFAGITLIGFTLGPVLPILLADTQQRVGLKHVANTVGLQIAAAGLGISVLPGIAAFVAERAGLETIGLYLFLVALASFLIHEVLIRYEQRVEPVAQPAV